VVVACSRDCTHCNTTCSGSYYCDQCDDTCDYPIVYYSTPEQVDMSQCKQAKQYFDKPVDDRPVMIPIPILPTNRRLSQIRRFHNR
jgi:hypothetical protein